MLFTSKREQLIAGNPTCWLFMACVVTWHIWIFSLCAKVWDMVTQSLSILPSAFNHSQLLCQRACTFAQSDAVILETGETECSISRAEHDIVYITHYMLTEPRISVLYTRTACCAHITQRIEHSPFP